jgi:AcrR family transcriptional regulator
LFSRHGVRAVGVDRIVAESGVAKMSLYRHFRSKDELVLTFLQERERRWTNEWLRAEAERRGATPAERMLAIFDVFSEWFALEDFEGCSFINVLLEFDDREQRVRVATVEHLSNIRGFLRELASEAGAADPDALAHQWHILMKGSIVAAGEGDRLAARRAQEIGQLLLEREAIAV